MSDALHIRLAQPDDRAAVMEMVKTVWGGNDYVPEMWDDWLTDSSGPLLVGTLGERPVALTKLSALGPGEDWFHGTRVDPDFRGRGFARALLLHCIELSRERGARTLRYLTDEDNPAMHQVADNAGMRLVYTPAWYRAHLRDGAAETVALAADRLPALLHQLQQSPLLARTAGMYSYEWRNLDLTPERLRAHLEGGEIVGLPGDGAWAIVAPRDGEVWLAHVEGAGDEVARLIAALRMMPATKTERRMRALLPPDAPCVSAMLANGFEGPEDPMRVYELRLR